MSTSASAPGALDVLSNAPSPTSDATPAAAASWLRLGQEHATEARHEEAIAAYSCGLALAAAKPGSIPAKTVADLHAHLGNACMMRGDLAGASNNYKAALRLMPELVSCWCNLGNIHVQIGKPQDAIAYYLQALNRNPSHWASRTNLAQALMATKQHLIAKALLLELSVERPHDSTLHNQLGKAHHELEELEPALASFQLAALLNPLDFDSIYWIGAIMHRRGDIAAARNAYAAAARIQPLIRRPAITSPAEFRILALYAPFGGNTPAEYLFKNAVYDTDTLSLFDMDISISDALVSDVKVVVNLISDADQAGGMLPVAADLVRRLGKPVVNDPLKILRTTRDAVAELLSDIPGCLVPKILRQPVGTELSLAEVRNAFPSASSMLVRPVGTHGGDDFDKIDSDRDLQAILAGPAPTDRYLIEYVDYGSSDGHFRKYRFIFVGEDVLPYHLAIGNDWKVHHVNTDMANQVWMQQEEAAFLDHPTRVFSAANYKALDLIRQRIGLDYFGIDCGLDAKGTLVVFEVNASMLVHDDNAKFPYKDSAVRRIKTAFDAMVAKLASTKV